jgi:hypothetical protein
LYLQIDMLFREIYGEIFSCMICVILFHIIINENSLFQIISHMSHKDTEQSTMQRSFCNTLWCSTDSVIRSLPNESSSVCQVHPRYVLHAHLIILHDEHPIYITVCLQYFLNKSSNSYCEVSWWLSTIILSPCYVIKPSVMLLLVSVRYQS